MAGELWGANTHTARVQIYTALYALGPMAMAYLTLVLKDEANRRTNAVLGAVTAVRNLRADRSARRDVRRAGFAVIVAITAALLIVWHAWQWPRGAEVTPPRQSQETARR